MRTARLVRICDRGWPPRSACGRHGHPRAARCGAESRVERCRRGVRATPGGSCGRPAVDRGAVCERAASVPCRREPTLLRAVDTGTGNVRVTVFGATGVVGQALLPLSPANTMSSPSHAGRVTRERIPWVQADVASGEGVAACARRRNVAYYLVHSLGARDFERQDREAARNVSREAAPAGSGANHLSRRPWRRQSRFAAHLRSRRETGENLASDGVPVTTLRAAMVIGKGSAAFETILGLVKRLPVMITPSWVSTPTQPIALQDIARYLAGVAGNAPTSARRSTLAARR